MASNGASELKYSAEARLRRCVADVTKARVNSIFVVKCSGRTQPSIVRVVLRMRCAFAPRNSTSSKTVLEEIQQPLARARKIFANDHNSPNLRVPQQVTQHLRQTVAIKVRDQT